MSKYHIKLTETVGLIGVKPGFVLRVDADTNGPELIAESRSAARAQLKKIAENWINSVAPVTASADLKVYFWHDSLLVVARDDDRRTTHRVRYVLLEVPSA